MHPHHHVPGPHPGGHPLPGAPHGLPGGTAGALPGLPGAHPAAPPDPPGWRPGTGIDPHAGPPAPPVPPTPGGWPHPSPPYGERAGGPGPGGFDGDEGSAEADWADEPADDAPGWHDAPAGPPPPPQVPPGPPPPGYGGPGYGGPGFGGPGFGGPLGFGAPGPYGPGFGPAVPRRGARVRRGDVRAAVLALLAEQPRNGYQLIREIARRSGGVWRPSPGSVYPALSQLADEDLVEESGSARRREFALTDAGRAYVAEHPEELAAPFANAAEAASDEPTELWQSLAAVHAATGQVVHAGTPEAVDAARRVLDRARRDIYRILAGDDED